MKAINPSAAGEVKPSDDTLSWEGLISQLTDGEQAEPEAEESESEEEVEADEVSEEVADEVADEETAEEEAESEEDEESEEGEAEIDLLSLSPDQIKDLAKRGKSRLLERIGELTAKNKALESKVAETTQVSQAKVVPQEQNPFKDLTSIEAITKKYSEIEKTLEATDSILEEYEDYGADEVITVGNQEFTKKQVKLANRNAREALTKYLPSQQQHLARLEQQSALSVQWQAQAKKEVPEIQDGESEIGKRYTDMVNDPLVAELKQRLPELGVQIEYVLAHAARSIFGKKPSVVKGAGTKLKVKPPASPVGAGSERSGKNPKAKHQEAMKRFEVTGSVDDWIAAQLS